MQPNISDEIEWTFPTEVAEDFAMDFYARCRSMHGGCSVYTGGHTVRLPLEIDIGVTFVTPRRAAYLIAHGRLPASEIKASCQTRGCVTPEHLVLGRARRRGSTVVTKQLILEILCEPAKSTRYLSRKFGISRKIIGRIRELGLKYPLPQPKKPSRPKPRYPSAGF